MGKCGRMPLRSREMMGFTRPIDDPLTAWEKSLDERIEKRIQNPPLEEDIDWKQKAEAELLHQNTKEQSPGKVRCKVCGKLFRGVEFVHKHIKKKHPKILQDFVEKTRQDSFFQGYCEDPDHLTRESFVSPFAHPPFGHGSPPFGPQRGPFHGHGHGPPFGFRGPPRPFIPRGGYRGPRPGGMGGRRPIVCFTFGQEGHKSNECSQGRGRPRSTGYKDPDAPTTSNVAMDTDLYSLDAEELSFDAIISGKKSFGI